MGRRSGRVAEPPAVRIEAASKRNSRSERPHAQCGEPLMSNGEPHATCRSPPPRCAQGSTGNTTTIRGLRRPRDRLRHAARRRPPSARTVTRHEPRATAEPRRIPCDDTSARRFEHRPACSERRRPMPPMRPALAGRDAFSGRAPRAPWPSLRRPRTRSSACPCARGTRRRLPQPCGRRRPAPGCR